MASTSLAEGSGGLVMGAERGTAPQSQSMPLLRQPRLRHNQKQLVRSHLASRRWFALRSGERGGSMGLFSWISTTGRKSEAASLI